MKNECMLLNCSRLLLALVAFKPTLEPFDESDYSRFNSRFQLDRVSTVMPLRAGEPPQSFKLRRDVLVPCLAVLRTMLEDAGAQARDLGM